MYCELYISGEFDQNVALDVLVSHCVLCNVFPMYSIVVDKASGEYRKEQGVKVQVFDIEVTDLVELWGSLQDALGIHCVWVDMEGFAGCITKLPAYLDMCTFWGVEPLTCSEY